MLQKYRQFARQIGIIGATNLLISLSGLILLPILTKTLPIEEYGTYVQITVTIGLVPGVVMLGLPYTMVRYLAAAKSREEIRECRELVRLSLFSRSLIGGLDSLPRSAARKTARLLMDLRRLWLRIGKSRREWLPYHQHVRY